MEREDMFKASVVQAVAERLTVPGSFRQEDFEIINQGGGSKAELRVQYRFKPEYFFSAQMKSTTTAKKTLACGYAPGEFVERGSRTVESVSQLLSAVEAWMGFLGAEMRALPLVRELEDRRREIEEILAEVQDVTDEPFSREEGEELRTRLEALEEDWRQRSGDDDEEVQERFSVIEQDLVQLKREIGSLSKQGWLKSWLVKVARWTEDPENRQFISAGTNAVRGLLTGGNGGG